jgi:hypothetical protein
MGTVNSLYSLDFFLGRNAIEDADLRGSPVARQSRLNALFQIEKNFSKERVTEAGKRETKLLPD